jgi:clan AA aspartic protease (TIGR02281 family)
MLWVLLSILGVAGLVLVLSGETVAIGGMESSTLAQAAIGVALLLFVASTVVLRPADAKAAGIDVDRLAYSVPVRTANGQAFAAPARIRRMAIGSIVMENVDALVAKPGALGQSLLGMTFLTRLRSYEVMGEFLTLRG